MKGKSLYAGKHRQAPSVSNVRLEKTSGGFISGAGQTWKSVLGYVFTHSLVTRRLFQLASRPPALSKRGYDPLLARSGHRWHSRICCDSVATPIALYRGAQGSPGKCVAVDRSSHPLST